MISADLSVMPGEYPAPDRSIFAGRSFVVPYTFAAVPSGESRFMSITVGAGYTVVIWSVAVGNVAGNVGNSPGLVRGHSGTCASPTSITPINLLQPGPDPFGFTACHGLSLEGGSLPGDGQNYNFGGNNILSGIRVYGPGVQAALEVKNLDNNASTITVSPHIAVFDAITIEDIT